MTELLERYLDRLVEGAGADVAVVWSRTGLAATASVVCARPAGLVAAAAPWPVTDVTTAAVIQRDPAVVAGLVPVSMRLALPRNPVAALSMALADPDLAVLLIWYGTPAGTELGADLRSLIAEEITYAARNFARRSRSDLASQRLYAVIDELKQGVVSVDDSLDWVAVNPAAAQLLRLEPGETRAADFAAAMIAMEGRALNSAEIVAMGRRLLADPGAEIECTWHFAQEPTHVKVSSRTVHKGAYSGRVWVFEDVSRTTQALHASESAQALLRASTDSMLDPQVLLEAVRDPGGQVIDFRYLSVNQAACSYLGFRETDLLGRTQLENSPNLEDSELQKRYFQCLQDGQPVILQDFTFFSEIFDDVRRYDIQATRAGADLLSTTWRDVTERYQTAHRIAESEALLRASADGMLNPQVLMEAVRGPDGRIADFSCRRANKATCSNLGVAEEELVGSSALQILPNLAGSGLLEHCVNCVETGEPVVLHDFSYFDEVLDEDRRYDIQATPAGADLVTLTWSDVTERYNAVRRLAESELLYRLIAENSSDAIVHARDGRFVWASPSIEGVLGAPPEHWLGRELRETVPVDDYAAHDRRMKTLADGHPVQARIRLIAADGVTHWIHIDSRPFYDSRGRQDGFAAALRLVDDEVAIEQQTKEARRQRARADARFRRSMETAAIAICIVAPDGALVEVNAAMCRLFGYDAETLVHLTWQELTAPEYLEADLKNVADVLEGRVDSYRLLKQYIGADGRRIWGDLSVSCIRDENGQVESFVSQIADITATIEATHLYRLLAENASDMVAHIRDGRFVWVSPSVKEVLGATQEYWIGRDATEVLPPDQLSIVVEGLSTLADDGFFQRRIRVQSVDGVLHWIYVHAKPFYDPQGRADGFTAALRVIDDEVAAQQEAEEARRQQAIADARYRRATDNAAIGIGLLAADGSFLEANRALCELLGYDEQTLLQKTWRQVTPPESLEVGEEQRRAVFDGNLDSFRIVKQYLRADGQRIWADVAVSGVRDENGQVVSFAAQIADITAEVRAVEQLAHSDAQNRSMAERLQRQRDRMAAELKSAAGYLASIMPRDLTGVVEVTSRYLPSRELGGDCFNYTWIDDDHLLVYLIDVSGHGIEPALLSVSVHNMLRSGSLGIETLLAPDAALTALNALFQMEQQGDHYFTIWYGVYQASTRTLRYATAGAPPALAFELSSDGVVSLTELSTPAVPVGTFEATVFTSASYAVPQGCRLLIFSDGAHDLALSDGRLMSFADFEAMSARLAVSSAWSLDELITELTALTPNGVFEDDCSLIQLTFD